MKNNGYPAPDAGFISRSWKNRPGRKMKYTFQAGEAFLFFVFWPPRRPV